MTTGLPSPEGGPWHPDACSAAYSCHRVIRKSEVPTARTSRSEALLHARQGCDARTGRSQDVHCADPRSPRADERDRGYEVDLLRDARPDFLRIVAADAVDRLALHALL